MKRLYLILTGTGVLLVLLAGFLFFKPTNSQTISKEDPTFWDVQSVDTMKYSRDLAREKLGDESFDEVIDTQIGLIAETGATHVAIGTPYDEEFIPFLTRWVDAARRHDLNVWFRGNFAGWEGWFDYQPMTREEHLEMAEEFIMTNGKLFEEGDIFSACPECENGGPGDPRITGDVEGHTNFLIEEYKLTNQAFRNINKNVRSNFASMNGDVARLIMDEETTKSLGGLVVMDHYVEDPIRLTTDVFELAEKSEGRVVLGEFGAPVPNIHGNLNEKEQAEWIDSALSELLQVDELMGVNYWVSFGGSTSLWNSDGSAKEAAAVLKKYYDPNLVRGHVVDEIGRHLIGASVKIGPRTVTTRDDGSFTLPFVRENAKLEVDAEGYKELEHEVKEEENVVLVLEKEQESVLFNILKRLYKAINKE